MVNFFPIFANIPTKHKPSEMEAAPPHKTAFTAQTAHSVYTAYNAYTAFKAFTAFIAFAPLEVLFCFENK